MIATPRPTVASRVTAASRIVVRLHRSGRSLGKCLHTRWVRCSSSQCASEFTGREELVAMKVVELKEELGERAEALSGNKGAAAPPAARRNSERVFGERRGRRRS
ncbi:hypothetical protein EMIHUDRAFT_441512, partial [Emiliania huxleyi CCMP1516]|uniref:Uncharacterized protein n=2 Tax=Emiliania huxleyi TaxID=2903 RepID=A0A0D3KD55_EMIH1